MQAMRQAFRSYVALACDKDVFTGANNGHLDIAGNERSPSGNREEKIGICTQ